MAHGRRGRQPRFYGRRFWPIYTPPVRIIQQVPAQPQEDYSDEIEQIQQQLSAADSQRQTAMYVGIAVLVLVLIIGIAMALRK